MHLWLLLWACVTALASAAPAQYDKDVLADLKEILEGKLNQREARQQDEILSDIHLTRSTESNRETQKDENAREADDILTDHGWTQEEVETLLERLPENDIRIMKEFAKLAVRLNTARRLVLELNQLHAKPKRAPDHHTSGFDPKYVGTREQDMKAGDKTAQKQKPSKESDSLALKLLSETNQQRKRQDAASAVTEQVKGDKPKKGKKPSDKGMEEALLTAMTAIVMKDRAAAKQQ